MKQPTKFAYLWALRPYAVLALVGAVLGGTVELQKQNALDTARSNYRREAAQESRYLARKIDTQFELIYQGIRTLARLPNVRDIDRYAKSFNKDAKASAQEIYNNLANNVAVSEVYIVPEDFNPDRIDPVTQKPEEPIAEFDELIAGRMGEKFDSVNQGRLRHGAQFFVQKLEIYEYRLMREQIASLKSRHPREPQTGRLSYPAIAGQEVITCDNTRYSLVNPNDADRKGLVYSVPFYGSNGELRGIVSAVILTHAVRDMIPDGNYTIANSVYQYEVLGRTTGKWKATASLRQEAHAAASPIYAESVPLKFPDLNAGWLLRAERPDNDFWSRPDTISALEKAKAQYLLLLFALLAGCGMIYILMRQRLAIELENMRLEARVADRTQALERALTAAERASEAKTRFLTRMSHEIRTPISGILGLTNLLSKTELDPEQRRKTHLLRRSADILLHLVNDVLDLSKIEAGQMVSKTSGVNLQNLLHSLVGTFQTDARNKGLRFDMTVDQAVPSLVMVKKDHLERVLLNLIGNAVKFTDDGSVSIRVSSPPEGRQNSERLTFQVSDTGIGIDPSKAERIFAPFGQADESITRRFGGTGLGLNISRSLVRELGGELTFNSVPGRGTTFSFTIPVTSSVAPSDIIDSTISNGQPGTVSAVVLLVEDNLVNREVARTYLEDSGCTVEVATTGIEALKRIEERRYDVILMDCQMPEMDGYKATRLIRAREKEREAKPVPIIALTAHALSDDKEKCLSCGMTDYLSKPFTAAQLIAVIRSSL